MRKNQRISSSTGTVHSPAPARLSIDTGLELAVVRTELALDRTQLAWVRTAFTLITAGLAIDKGGEALHQARVLAGTNWVQGSHLIGTSLTAAATLFLVITSMAYFKQARQLAQLKCAQLPWFPPALMISFFVIFLGCLLEYFLLTWK